MYNTDFFNFITLYNTLISNLINRDNLYQISFYYLDNEFNIKISSLNNKEVVYKDYFKVNYDEYNNLIFIIGCDFIKSYNINLAFFDNISLEDSKIYYSSEYSKKNILNYETSKIHIIKNNKFEIKFYYFNGINKIGYKMQDIALLKLNKKKEKELIKKYN